jgi:putative transposase
MREELRFLGKIMGAVVSFSGARWFISVHVETEFCRRAAPAGSLCGVDLGSRTLATMAGTANEADTEHVAGPKPRKRLLGRIKPMQRRVSLQKHRAKKFGTEGISAPAYPPVAAIAASCPNRQHPKGCGAQVDDRPDEAI